MANSTSGSQADEIDLHQIYGALANNWRLIAIVMSVFVTLSAAYAFLATPIYQSDVMVQVEQRAPTPGLTAQSLVQSIASSTSQDVTEIALLTSRMVVGKAVDDLDLDIVAEPRRLPLIGAVIARHFTPTAAQPVAHAWFGLRSIAWGGEVIRVSRFDVPDRMLDSKFRLTAQAGDRYVLDDADGNEVLRGQVGQDATRGDVSIKVDALRAEPGTTFSLTRNLTLTAIQNLQNDLVTQEQGKDSGIIMLSYQHEDPMLANAVLRDISDAYVKQNIDRSAAEAAKSLKFVQEQLPKIKNDLDRAQSALTKYQSSAHFVDLGIETKSLLDQVVAVEANIQQVKLQQAEAAIKYQPGFPALRGFDDQIAQLNVKKAALQTQIGQLPDKQQALLQYTRDVEVSTQTYTALLTQAQQLDVARAGTVGNVRIVDPPAVDTTKPVKPKRLLIVAGGAVVGFFIACLAVFIRQMVNRGLEDPAAIEELGVPVYASLPLSAQRGEARTGRKDLVRARRRQLVAVDNPADLASEALRSLRTSLFFATAEGRNNRLMITGASPNAGKTFVSCNLGAVVAQAGQRVLVIDADMRRGDAHKVFAVSPDNGLSDLIAGRIDIDTAIRKQCGQPNLDFIPRGNVPPNPSELLMRPDFGRLLDELSSRYDMLIIDTPPILAVTDSAIIGRHAGTNLLVVRFQMNNAREVDVARQRFETSGVRLHGVIFNAIERRVAGYLNYGQYAYGSDE
ncbi:polysaccharide biosynthesis tyrosine autokinase [Burkholderia latens]|uniref:polysaccharide biosynthesis tyrosine autokinase n=1 Tax=Burkholderia latens TaxID=488446 RepID=UPI001C96ABF0|nr:polysaccharide biosynthesis tyrosine autokinase [Burkholderia latens]MBY4695272.1 polysaccharide biosynthesis tyrosine autokinase [Burkholderia latens]